MSKFKAHYEQWPDAIQAAVNLLNKSNKTKLFLFEQNRNLGDTLHLIPIIRHYRINNPDAEMVLIVGKPYINAWEYNNEIDSIVTVPSLNPKQRIALRHKLLELPNKFNIVSPSIFPYGEVWPELKWSYANIADQYLYNAKIKNITPDGGRKLYINITEDDRLWAKKFVEKHNIKRDKSCAFEYISYSHQPQWNKNHFSELVTLLNKKSIKCISLAGPKEHLIPNTIDARGITWRQTVALLNNVGYFCGIGSGLTMVAASTTKQPKIIELAVSESITMKSCGYADSIKVGMNYNDITNIIYK